MEKNNTVDWQTYRRGEVMTNPDRWLQRCAEDADQYEDNEKKKAEVIECLRNNEPIWYAKGRSVTSDNCDLHDKVCQNQQVLMTALANNNDAEVLAIMYRLFNQEVESLVDLVSD